MGLSEVQEPENGGVPGSGPLTWLRAVRVSLWGPSQAATDG